MLTPLKPEISGFADLSHEARKFRTILWAFERNVDLLLSGTGLTYAVDHGALAQAFAAWREVFDKTKYLAGVNRADYIIYAAGIMLRELIKANPARISGSATGQNAVALTSQLERWPEGYVYTSFCLAFVSSIIDESGKQPVNIAEEPAPGFWDSFKENVNEQPEMAVAFFDFICRAHPNWDAPDAPHLRFGMQKLEQKIGRTEYAEKPSLPDGNSSSRS